jgi:hypothetical protein
MPKLIITMEITLPGEDAEHVAEAFAEELLREARAHLLDGEQVDLLGVQPAARRLAHQ